MKFIVHNSFHAGDVIFTRPLIESLSAESHK
jgi:hypothetical protein